MIDFVMITSIRSFLVVSYLTRNKIMINKLVINHQLNARAEELREALGAASKKSCTFGWCPQQSGLPPSLPSCGQSTTFLWEINP